MNILELMLTLMIAAGLSMMAIGGYRAFVVRTHVNADIAAIQTSLQFAREQALITGQSTVTCEASQCLVQSPQDSRQFLLSTHNSIVTRAFPAGSEGGITFVRGGITSSQNGSIYVCPRNNIQYAMRVVFNQGGRIYKDSVVNQTCTQLGQAA